MLPPSNTATLFDEPELPLKAEAAPAASALSVQPPTQAPLSPAARAFNLQLTRIDKLKSQLHNLDALGQAHRHAVHQSLTPLQKRQVQCLREMALCLDARLQGKLLTSVQRKTACEILCGVALTLATDGDIEMAALHDRHSPRTLAQLDQDRADEVRAQLEAALGAPLEATHEGASADELLHEGMARLRESMEEEQARRRAAADKRKARKKPGAAQSKAQTQQADAETTLRSLFRQLASALHPDREPDAQARLRKTALMSEANAAYGRKDLVALMQIQQRAELADPDAAARMSDEKLTALTLLLKQQVAELERERVARHHQLAAEFDIPFGFGVTAKTLQVVLNEQVLELEEELELMTHDLERVQDDADVKRWLSQQRNASKRIERMERDFSLSGFF